jgi:hypothetical protein
VKRSASFSTRQGNSAWRLASVALVLSVGAFIAIVSACSNQGEGERCEVENGNDDCKTDEGLLCWPQEQLGRGSNADRCCPAIREKSTHPYCKTTPSIGDGGETPPDTGPAPTPDAGGDGGSDADAGDASDGSNQ